MQIKVNAFPAVYVNTICTKHNCSIEITLGESKRFQSRVVVGSQITARRCEQGGFPDSSDSCSEFWILQILAGGDVIVTQ